MFNAIALTDYVWSPAHTHTNQYLSHKIGEEEHIAEESCPSQQVADTQAAVVAWHVDDSLQQRSECHPLLGLQIQHHRHQRQQL